MPKHGKTMKNHLITLLFVIHFFGSILYSASIVIDPDVEHQTIEGWGASSNFYEEQIRRLPNEVRERAFDFVYQDLGTNILCIRLYSGFQTEEDGEYNWQIMATQRMIVEEALERGQIITTLYYRHDLVNTFPDSPRLLDKVSRHDDIGTRLYGCTR